MVAEMALEGSAEGGRDDETELEETEQLVRIECVRARADNRPSVGSGRDPGHDDGLVRQLLCRCRGRGRCGVTVIARGRSAR
jgi:hypothetical protein